MFRLPALLVSLLSVLALAAPAQALELGVQDDPVLLTRAYSDQLAGLDRAVEMGADRVRVNLQWAYTMPEDQRNAAVEPLVVDWQFGELERLYEAATARALKLQVTLTGPAPVWAHSGGGVGATNPHVGDFREFASAAALRFAGRIDRWSTWNEPNWHSRLHPAKKAPRRYAALHRAAYGAIKAADPAADVLIGELMPGANRTKSTQALEFLRRMTRRGAPLYADGFALHPYNFSRRPKAAKARDKDIVEMGSLSRLTRALNGLRRSGRLRTTSGAKMPVYLTEFGYFTSGPVRLKPKRHAAWMREAWRIADRNRRVVQLLQYGLIDPWPEQVTWRTAVMKRDGTPRPAYYALQSLAR
jgi:hypothetical protein